MARPLLHDKAHTAADVDHDDGAQLADLRGRRLARARQLAGQAVSDLQAAGVLDAKGRRIRKDLPRDMQPDSKADV